MPTKRNPYSPEWFVYTGDPTTFDYITQYLREHGERQQDALMTDQRLSDRSDLVTLRSINLADKQVLERAAAGPLQPRFRDYLGRYSGGPIHHFEKRKPDAAYPKIVLLASNTLSYQDLIRKVATIEHLHPKSKYIIADNALSEVVDAMISRGFIHEVGIYGGNFGDDRNESTVYKIIRGAIQRNVSVVSMDEGAKHAINALNGGAPRQGQRRARVAA